MVSLAAAWAALALAASPGPERMAGGSAPRTVAGDIRINASGLVEAHTSGSGDIHIYGDPKRVDMESSGSGDVILH